MCIRDSTKADKAQAEAIAAAATDATTKANNAKSAAISTAAADATNKANTAPVSYTHLDVYKRQVYVLDQQIPKGIHDCQMGWLNIIKSRL